MERSRKQVLMAKSDFSPAGDFNANRHLLAHDHSNASAEYTITALSDSETCYDSDMIGLSDDGATALCGRLNSTSVSPQYYQTAAPSQPHLAPRQSSTTTSTASKPAKQRRNVAIAPKQPATAAGGGHSATAAATATTTPRTAKKRDEKRRVVHNEVERRRRDKINHWIEKLSSIIQPADGQPVELPLPDPLASTTAFPAEGENTKGAILSKACEYVMALHHKVNTLNECLKQSEQINDDTQRLRDSNARLVVENELLRERLTKMGIRQPCIVLSPASTAQNPKSAARM